MNHVERALLRGLEENKTAKTAEVKLAGGVGVVSDFTSGVVTVTFDGFDIQAPKNAAYTPTVSDQVVVLFFAGSPVVLCKLDGFPTV